MKRLLIVLLAIVLGGGAGFLAGRYSVLSRNPMMGIEVPPEPPPSRLTGRSRVFDALLVTDPFERVEAILALSRLSTEEIGDLPEAMGEQMVDRGIAEASLLLRLWAREDPEAAARWAFRASFDVRPVLVDVAVEEWARRDPQQVAAWLDAITGRMPGPVTEAAERALMRGWVDSGNYVGVAEYLLSRGVSFDRQRSILAFVRRLTQRAGPEATIAWAEALPEDDERFKLAAFRQAMSEVARADLELAKAWCEEVCDGPYGDSLERNIAWAWVFQDGPAALEWLSKMEAGTERELAVQDAFTLWWRRGRDGAARQWIESVGRSGLEEWMAPAVIAYAPMLAREQPEEAAAWATLAPESRRESVLMAVGVRWGALDEEAAAAWIAQAPMSDEAREKTLLALERRAKDREPKPE